VLAEDHAVMLKQLAALLACEFDVVSVVESGRALISACETCRPDVIVSDMGMPDLNGIAAAQVILAGDPNARIVFITVRDEPEVIRCALSSGALGYVMKCDAGDELLTAVRTALDGRPFLSSSARAALEDAAAWRHD
jgi:DNA-binding NarL/FixJ family response regulator